MWVLSCLFKALDVEHLISRWEQLIGLSTSVDSFMLVQSTLDVEHLKSQWEKLNGLFPV